MIRIAGLQDPLIGRAFAAYDILCDEQGVPESIDVVYIAKGKFTRRAAVMREGQIEVCGPLGNGFCLPQAERLILVAGGIGQTPFLSVAKEASGARRFGTPQREAPKIDEIVMCYGARGAEYFAGLDDFRSAGVDLRLATDDGSVGHHGLVTELLRQTLGDDRQKKTHVLCCGPEPMMEAVAKVAGEFEVSCQVSLETPMACGVGVCFSCVAKIKDEDGQWDYKRTCVEGPVFPASQIEW
jgi:dihydroorotate dehydrogenase electron transfer subunit